MQPPLSITDADIEVDRRLVSRPIIFWPHAWLRQEQHMRKCSPTARGIFIDLMAFAYKGVPYGSLASESGPLPEELIASKCGIKVKELRGAIQELLKYSRLVRNPDGTISIPLMLKSRRQQLRRAARREAERVAAAAQPVTSEAP